MAAGLGLLAALDAAPFLPTAAFFADGDGVEVIDDDLGEDTGDDAADEAGDDDVGVDLPPLVLQ